MVAMLRCGAKCLHQPARSSRHRGRSGSWCKRCNAVARALSPMGAASQNHRAAYVSAPSRSDATLIGERSFPLRSPSPRPRFSISNLPWATGCAASISILPWSVNSVLPLGHQHRYWPRVPALDGRAYRQSFHLPIPQSPGASTEANLILICWPMMPQHKASKPVGKQGKRKPRRAAAKAA